jgi:tetratricopeptide (TPR) repeat protein
MPNNRTQPEQLDAAVRARIQELCAQAAALAREQDFDTAIVRYCEAFALLPMPVERWPIANSILTALGDTYFRSGDYKSAADVLIKAMRTPGAIQNPFIRLRRGQIAFESGQLANAEQEMAAAYVIEGRNIFDGEDPKYWAFLEPKLFPTEVES